MIADRVELIISIHAPLAGSDLPIATLTFSGSNFNPRSPCGERPQRAREMNLFKVFQSTLPLRGATYHLGGIRPAQAISIHAPLAGSDALQETGPGQHPISIHAPLAGSDTTG